MEKKKILLVEDNNDLREVVKMFLENMGYEVIPARDGVEALNILRNKKPDIRAAILDMMMRSHGGTVGDFLKNHPTYKEIPIIYHTGLTEEQIDKRFLEGAHYVHKDGNSLFALKELLNRVVK
ncbi:MAG: response regulator [Caldiserica bacterium]|nr:response regulator [Caldisericota bacterium]